MVPPRPNEFVPSRTRCQAAIPGPPGNRTNVSPERSPQAVFPRQGRNLGTSKAARCATAEKTSRMWESIPFGKRESPPTTERASPLGGIAGIARTCINHTVCGISPDAFFYEPPARTEQSWKARSTFVPPPRKVASEFTARRPPRPMAWCGALRVGSVLRPTRRPDGIRNAPPSGRPPVVKIDRHRRTTWFELSDGCGKPVSAKARERKRRGGRGKERLERGPPQAVGGGSPPAGERARHPITKRPAD